jgi:hypothetical protein
MHARGTMAGIPIGFENRVLFFANMAFEPTRGDDLFDGLHIVALAFEFLVNLGLIRVSSSTLSMRSINARS